MSRHRTQFTTYSKCKLGRSRAKERFPPKAFSSNEAGVNNAQTPNLNDNYLHNAAEHIDLAAAAKAVRVELNSLCR